MKHTEETKKMFDDRYQISEEEYSFDTVNTIYKADAEEIKSFITSRELALIEKIEEWGKKMILSTKCEPGCPFCDRGLLRKCDAYEEEKAINETIEDLLTFLQTLK